MVRIRCDTARFYCTPRCFVSASWPCAGELGTDYCTLEYVSCERDVFAVGSTRCRYRGVRRDGQLLDFPMALLGNAPSRPESVGRTL